MELRKKLLSLALITFFVGNIFANKGTLLIENKAANKIFVEIKTDASKIFYISEGDGKQKRNVELVDGDIKVVRGDAVLTTEPKEKKGGKISLGIDGKSKRSIVLERGVQDANVDRLEVRFSKGVKRTYNGYEIPYDQLDQRVWPYKKDEVNIKNKRKTVIVIGYDDDLNMFKRQVRQKDEVTEKYFNRRGRSKNNKGEVLFFNKSDKSVVLKYRMQGGKKMFSRTIPAKQWRMSRQKEDSKDITSMAGWVKGSDVEKSFKLWPGVDIRKNKRRFVIFTLGKELYRNSTNDPKEANKKIGDPKVVEQDEDKKEEEPEEVEKPDTEDSGSTESVEEEESSVETEEVEEVAEEATDQVVNVISDTEAH